MRIPEYLSPTSLMLWEKDQEEYYLRYLADQRPPRFPQTQPMAVGAAFDAYVKNYYHKRLFGPSADPAFELDTIFEDQVEPHNRDWARPTGEYAFNCYRTSGALADLLVELEQAQKEPQFESTVRGTVNDVPLLGKPDLFYIHKNGRKIILDWKVNGFCGNYNTSPKRGFVRCRDGWKDFHSKTHGMMHKDCHPFKVDGVLVNIAEFMETVNKDWGLQLSTYAWMMGAEVGSEFICALDQLACAPDIPDEPRIRVAEHRLLVGQDFQHKAIQRYKELWTIINSDHIFRDIDKVQSAARCDMLDLQYKAFEDDDDFIKEMTGRL